MLYNATIFPQITMSRNNTKRDTLTKSVQCFYNPAGIICLGKIFKVYTIYININYFKATIDGHAFIIGRYITIMIVCNILIPIASKIWLLCIVHTNLSIKGKKKCFLLQNCPCVMVGAKIGYVLGPLVHGKVVVEFDRKVLFVDCLL